MLHPSPFLSVRSEMVARSKCRVRPLPPRPPRGDRTPCLPLSPPAPDAPLRPQWPATRGSSGRAAAPPPLAKNLHHPPPHGMTVASSASPSASTGSRPLSADTRPQPQMNSPASGATLPGGKPVSTTSRPSLPPRRVYRPRWSQRSPEMARRAPRILSPARERRTCRRRLIQPQRHGGAGLSGLRN